MSAAPFTYREVEDRTVRIAWNGRHVVTLAGAKAARFLAQVAGADPEQAQLLMARVTGNFKRGNERSPEKRKRR